MRKAASLFVIAVLAVLLGVQLATARVVVTVGSQPLGVVSIGETWFVPCANHGQGEVIYLFGPEVIRWTYVTYSDGSVRGHLWFQVDFKAIGETTGLTYQSKAIGMNTFLVPPGETTQTGIIVENFVIAAGNGASFHYHENLTYSYSLDPTTGQPILAVYHGNIFLACK
jgi:hypothetical protein